MRVLFTTYAVRTHFHTMVPLAWALSAAGHEVRVASQPALTDVITAAGLTTVPVGRDHTLWRSAQRFLTRRFAELNPEVSRSVREANVLPFDLADESPEKITWDHLQPAYDNVVRTWYKLVNGPMVDDLVTFARHWRPDLVVWEPNTYAGAIAATASGAAHARLLWGVDIFGFARARYLALRDEGQPDEVDPLGDWLRTEATRFGTEFTETTITGNFTLDQLPDALRLPADLHYVRMRYVPYNGTSVVPRWLWEQPARPRIALTLGVTATESFGGCGVGVQDVLDALSDLDVEIVATVAEREQHLLRHVPDNTRVVPYVPLQALMPTSTAAIHHAGFGTLCTTLTYGVPSLSLPERFDEPLLARRVAARNAGLGMPMREATGDKVREGVLRLLADPTLRAGAGALRAELAALPTPGELVGELERLTEKYRGG